ncbi:hypothetical protein D3C73_895710 [compost metagenome]
MGGFYSTNRLLHQHLNNRLLEAAGYSGHIRRKALHLALVDHIEHGRLQAAEAEIIGIRLQPDAGKRHRFLRLAGQPVHMGAARIREPERPRYLVIGFAHSVIAGPANNPEPALLFHADQFRMPAGYNQRHIGILQLLNQPVGINMTGNMMCANQGLAPGKRKAFGSYNTYQQCSDKSGSLGNRNCRQLFGLNACRCQRLLYHQCNHLYMLAGCHLWHDTAERAMGFDLAGDHVRKHLTAVLDHRYRSFIAAGFDSQYKYRLNFTRFCLHFRSTLPSIMPCSPYSGRSAHIISASSRLSE